MKDKILSLFTNPSEMTPEQIVLNIGIAAVLGFFIFISYYISHRGTIYSKKFNASLVILAALTGTVMTVIGNNSAFPGYGGRAFHCAVPYCHQGFP